MSRHWRRRATRKPGVPYIGDREELDEKNLPARTAADAKHARPIVKRRKR